uniref:tRNA wybutosine-synthesizing protein 2 homolog n=1 Tax=Angiostrongylus cantonensis TaxID=6313 RepID=A0A0K0DCR8_ANGCA
MKVDSNKVSLIQSKVRLEKYLIKNLGRVGLSFKANQLVLAKMVQLLPDHFPSSIMDADDPKYKLFLFDPSLVNESSTELKAKIESMVKEYAVDVEAVWETREVAVAFEDWDLRRIFRAVLPKDLEFSSYSQVGHIVHVNLRENLLPTVVNKIDSITNEYRNFELDLLAGADNYVTELTENGLKYRLDFSKVFFRSFLFFSDIILIGVILFRLIISFY